MTKQPTILRGTISYQIELSDEHYNVIFEETNEMEGIKNSLACVAHTLRVVENTLHHMDKCKKQDRKIYNAIYKSIYNDTCRIKRELKTMMDGVVSDLLETRSIEESAKKIMEASKTTIQNEIIDK